MSDLHLLPHPFHLCEGSSRASGLSFPAHHPGLTCCSVYPSPTLPHCRSGQQVLPKDELCAPSSPWCSERKPPNGRLTSSKRLREATSPSGSSLLALAGSTAASGVPYLSSALHLTLFFIVCLDLKLAPWGRMWLTPLCPRAQFHLYLLSDCGIPDTLS